MREAFLKIKILLVFSFLLHSIASYGTHAVGIDLQYECLGGNTYRFTLNFYRDCDGVSAPDPSANIGISSNSCGVSSSINLTLISTTEVSPICPNQLPNSTCSGGSLPGIQQYIYTGTYTLPLQCNDWVIGYSLCCRNNAITNLGSPGSQSLYAEATLDNTGGLCNNSPVFTSLPVPYLCANQDFNYNHGAVDVDGDSLVYSLVNAKDGPGVNIPYVGSFSPTNPLSTNGGFGFDNATGQMSFNAKNNQQAVVTVLVQEYRNGALIGSTIRDLQLVVLNCSNNLPTATGIDGTNNFSIDVCAGFPLCFDIFTNDPDAGQNVTLTWNSGIQGATFNISGTPFPEGTFCWTSTPADLGPNNFSVSVSDDACPIPGTNAYTYTINVIPNPNPLIEVNGPFDICEEGCVMLDETVRPSGVIYSWSPTAGLSDPNIPDPTACPQITTTYTLSAIYPDECVSSDQVTVTVQPSPTVDVFPVNSVVCAGSSLQLTATTDAGANLLWSTGEITPSIVVTPSSDTFYTVEATNSYGCTSSDTAWVTYSPPPPPQICNNIYVTTTGTGSGLSPSDPTDLVTAVSLAQCNNLTIKMATGTYVINDPISISSLLTIEGGYDASNNWMKSSQAGATTIQRSAMNPEGPPEAQRLVAIYANGANFFRLQDLTITTVDAPVTNQQGMSTYSLHLTACANYDIVRCQILPGDASSGAQGPAGSQGAAGPAGQNGQNQNGGSGGGNGGNGGDGGDEGGIFGGADNGEDGQNAPGGGAAGGDGGNDASGLCGFVTGSPSNGSDGTNGTASNATGALGSVGPAGIYSGGFYLPGAQGGAGGAGGTGNGGGGGGGGGGEGGICQENGGGGGGGGGGGAGGLGGEGGYGGGASIAIYLFNNGSNGNLIDCNVQNGNPGTGGQGGIGGQGGTGGSGGQGDDDGGTRGGNGGNGGDGGQGGAGGSGAAGDAQSVYLDSGNSLATQNTNFNLGSQPVINVENLTCANTPIGFSAANSSNWDFGTDANPATDNGASVSAFYSTIGRKDVTYGSDEYSGFVHIAIDNTYLPEIVTTAEPYGMDTFLICIGENADLTTPTPAIGYAWNFGGAVTPNVDSSQTVNGLAFTTTGIFTIKLWVNTDCCGWTIPDSIILIVEPAPDIVLTGDTLLCPGESATLDISGSSSYEWIPNVGIISDPVASVPLNPTATTPYLITGFSPSGYCTVQRQVTVSVNEKPSLTTSITDAICSNDGQITVNTSGGSGDFSYSWDDPNNQATATASSLFSGNYMVTVMDNITGCSSVTNAYVGTSGPSVYISNSTNVTCYGGDDGAATAAVAGNYTAPFIYTWSHGPSGATVNSLTAGTYEVTFTDNAGCSSIATAYIAQPDSLFVNATVLDSNVCVDANEGRIVAVADGGSGGYNYSWNTVPVQLGDTANLLPSGEYIVEVTDDKGCTVTDTAIVGVLTSPQFDTLLIKPKCVGGNDGQIVVTPVSGPAASYSYVWDPPSLGTDSIASGLTAGNYSVNINFGSGCDTTISFTLTDPVPDAQFDTTVFHPLCSGGNDGQIVITPIAGTVVQNYAWTPSSLGTDSIANGLRAGNYSVIITDADGCDTSLSFTIVNPNTIFEFDNQMFNPKCIGSSDGSIIVTPIAGAGGYSYDWNSLPDTDSIVTGLSATNYSVLVTDVNGCDTLITLTLNDPAPITVSILPQDSTIIFGDSIRLITNYSNNVALPPAFTWTPSDGLNCDTCQNPIAAPESEITYTVQLVDSNNCIAEATVTIGVDPDLALDIPNVFTPNGDDLNEVLYVLGSGIDELDFKIFDRWGELMFKSYDIADGWDGRFKGKMAPAGVYVFRVEATYLNGSKKRLKGSVTLIR